MKTNKILVITIAFCFVLVSVATTKMNAEESVPSTMDLLRSTKWQEYKNGTPQSHFLEYGEKEYISRSHIPMPRDSNYVWTRICPYYLSDSITRFDYDKVGSAKNGKYIIFQKEATMLYIGEIMKLDSTEMILRIPGGTPHITLRYKAVK